MDDFLSTISNIFLGNGAVIVIGCFIIGTLLKGTFKSLPNKFIPYVNIIVANVLGFIIPGTFEDDFIVSKVVLLSFLGLSSTGLYEAICAVVKERFSVDIKQIYNNISDNKKSDNQTPEDDTSVEDNSDE